MTSRNLFFKLCLQEFKKRIWSVAVIFVIMFFTMPVSAMLVSQSISDGFMVDSLDAVNQGIIEGNMLQKARALQSYYISSSFNFSNEIYVFLLVVFAVMLAVSGFSYLNSRKKVDFTHSMPVRREELFAVKFLVGFVNYALPLLLNVALTVGVVFINRNGAFKSLGIMGNVAAHAGWFSLMSIVYFLLFYSVAVVAMLLVGNTIIGFLGIGVLYCYNTLFAAMISLCKTYFFDTYCSEYEQLRTYDPMGIMMRQLGSLSGKIEYMAGETAKLAYSQTLGSMYIALAITAAAIIFAVILMKLRASESAGKALAFKYSEPVIKIAILVPGVMAGGVLMYLSASVHNIGWMIFGIIASFLLISAVLEMILRLDFKGALKHKWSAFAGGGIAVFVLMFFAFDLGNFDSKLPKLDRIESIGVAFGNIGMENQAEYYTVEMVNGREVQISGNIAELTKLTGESLEKAYAMAEYLSKNYGWSTEASEKVTLDNGEVRDVVSSSVQICYRLKNGKEMYRSYPIDMDEEFFSYAEEVFSTPEYQGIFLRVLENAADCEKVYYQTNYYDGDYYFDKGESQEFLNMYMEELKGMTLKENVYECPEAVLEFYAENEVFTGNYPVFADFENTLSYMSERGIAFKVDIKAAEVESITIMRYSDDYTEKEYSKPEEIKEILENCVEPGLADWNGYYWNGRGDYEVLVKLLTDYEECYYYLKDVPDFVKGDFE